MKKILFLGAILFASLSFANTANPQNFDSKTPSSQQELKETNKEVRIMNVEKKSILKKQMYMYTVEFEINCGGNIGHMTVDFPSENTGFGFLIDLTNAINSGTAQGCQMWSQYGGGL